jgi:CNT family concentrative nucleoside transporter
MIYPMEMIPNQGMSLESLSRGVMGMLVLILIAYALSNDRKNIPWKVVGLGLLSSAYNSHRCDKNHMDQKFF